MTIIDTIKGNLNNMNSNIELTYNVDSKYYSGNLSIVNLSWYTPFKPYGDIILTAFIYIFFVWRVFIHTPNIIHGLGGDAESSIKFTRRGE